MRRFLNPKQSKKRFYLRILAFAATLFWILIVFFNRVRPIIFQYAVSAAETMVLDAANRAVVDVLNEEEISYDDIVFLSRNAQGTVTSLETNIVKLNTLKSVISNRLSQIVASQEDYVIRIPVGSFFSAAYTGGWGPQIPFRMRLTATARVDFSHEFRAAGINQVLHIVMIDMDIHGSLVVPGGQNAVSVSTSVFAAQTIIAGIVPGAYTQVIEGGETEDIAGLINDYGANEE